jgi:hypothetical protein
VHPRLPYGIMSGAIVGDVKSNYLFNLSEAVRGEAPPNAPEPARFEGQL